MCFCSWQERPLVLPSLLIPCCSSASVTAVSLIPSKPQLPVHRAVIFWVLRGPELLWGCFKATYRLICLLFPCITGFRATPRDLVSPSAQARKWGVGFWARVKNLPAVSAFFSLLPISGKSGGPDISSLRDLFLLGVWLLSFVLLFTSFCWKERILS